MNSHISLSDRISCLTQALTNLSATLEHFLSEDWCKTDAPLAPAAGSWGVAYLLRGLEDRPRWFCRGTITQRQ